MPAEISISFADGMQSIYLADLSASVAGVDTLYAVETAGATINKYSLIGSTWTLNNTVPSGGIQNLTGVVNGSSVTLYGAQSTKEPHTTHIGANAQLVRERPSPGDKRATRRPLRGAGEPWGAFRRASSPAP